MRTIKEIVLDSVNDADLIQMNEQEIQRYRNVLLEICSDVFEFCQKYQLNCMLGGGSALGAIRHKGFIPWDDDVDLIMPRDDYDKFAKKFTEEMGCKYDVFVPDGEHNVINAFMKVSKKGTRIYNLLYKESGILIDIFPIENTPKNRVIRWIKGIVANVYLRSIVSVFYYQKKDDDSKRLFAGSFKSRCLYYIRCSLGFILSIKPFPWWYCKFDRFAQTKKRSEFCTIPTGRKHYNGEVCRWSDFLPPKPVEFEGRHFYVPANVDKYLSNLYGDYMTLPPIEKRERHFNVSIDAGYK